MKLPSLLRRRQREDEEPEESGPSGYEQRLEDFQAGLAALSERQTSIVIEAWNSLSKTRRDGAWAGARAVTKAGGVKVAKPAAEAVTSVQRWASRRPESISKEDWREVSRLRGRAAPPLIGAGVALVLGDDLEFEAGRTLLTPWRAAERYGAKKPRPEARQEAGPEAG